MSNSRISSTVSSFESSSVSYSPTCTPNSNSNLGFQSASVLPISQVSATQLEFFTTLESTIVNSIIIVGMITLRNPTMQSLSLEKFYALSRHNSAIIRLPRIASKVAISNFNPLEDLPVDAANIINLEYSYLLQELCQLPSKYYTSDRFKHYLMPTLIR